MGNVNEILRRKSLLKDGVSETVYYGEPIEHPDMWKVVLNCDVAAEDRWIVIYQKLVYKKIIINDVIVLDEGEITEAGMGKIWFTNPDGTSVNNNAVYNSTTDSLRRRLWFAERGHHIMYFTVASREHWLYNGVQITAMRSPCEEYMNNVDRTWGAFGGVTNSNYFNPTNGLDKRGIIEALTSTPISTINSSTYGYMYRLFKKVKVPIGATAAYEVNVPPPTQWSQGAGPSYAGLEIEEFKFTPIPDN